MARARATVIPITGQSATLIATVEDHLNDCALEAQSVRGKRSDFKHILDFFGDTPPESITPLLCKQFADHQIAKGYKPATINRHLCTLKSFVKYLNEHEFLPRDFSAKIKLLKAKRPAPKFLKAEEVAALRHGEEENEDLKTRNDLIVEMALRCGLRRSEIVGVNYSQVNLSAQVFEDVRRKGKKFEDVSIANSSVLSKLNAYILTRSRLLEEWQRRGDKRLVPPVVNKLPLLLSFHSAKASDPESFRLSGETVRHVIKQRGGAAVYPHKLRHQFGRDVLQATNDLRIVQRALGHSNINTTMVYVEAMDDELKNAVRGLS